MRYKVSVKFHKDFFEADGSNFVIGVMARPEKGKANEEVVEKIAKYLRVPRSSVRIISGVSSKKKVVEVD